MFHVVLVEPEIPPNTGNIARLCAATGAMLHLVEPLGFKIDDKTLKRAGLDYWKHVQWKLWPDYDSLRAAYPQGRFVWVETGGTQLYDQWRYEEGDFLVFGRETKGLAEAVRAKDPQNGVEIPMTNHEVRSLNLSNCVAIVLFEALRQERMK